MSSIRSLRLCCHSSNRLRTPGSICKRPKESTIKSTRKGCPWRRSVTARTNYRWKHQRWAEALFRFLYVSDMFPSCRTKRRRWNRNGRPGYLASYAKTSPKSVGKILCKASRANDSRYAYSRIPIKKGKCDASTVCDRPTKFGALTW